MYTTVLGDAGLNPDGMNTCKSVTCVTDNLLVPDYDLPREGPMKAVTWEYDDFKSFRVTISSRTGKEEGQYLTYWIWKWFSDNESALQKMNTLSSWALYNEL